MDRNGWCRAFIEVCCDEIRTQDQDEDSWRAQGVRGDSRLLASIRDCMIRRIDKTVFADSRQPATGRHTEKQTDNGGRLIRYQA